MVPRVVINEWSENSNGNVKLAVAKPSEKDSVVVNILCLDEQYESDAERDDFLSTHSFEGLSKVGVNANDLVSGETFSICRRTFDFFLKM